MSKQALLIFARNPEAGKVKTRLAATLGNEMALAIYKKLLKRTIAVTQNLPVDKIVYFSNGIEGDDFWDSKHYYKQVQQGNDLGKKMKNAFASTFDNGYDRLVIIGTDCPGLEPAIIMGAFVHLNVYDVVIGPAEDGGYYLLGMKRLYPQLFENISWSTSTVFNDTLKKCDCLGLKYHLLPVLNDVDEEADLKTFKL
jgi:rSAM/selenodomain-associated transferase 1